MYSHINLPNKASYLVDTCWVLLADLCNLKQLVASPTRLPDIKEKSIEYIGFVPITPSRHISGHKSQPPKSSLVISQKTRLKMQFSFKTYRILDFRSFFYVHNLEIITDNELKKLKHKLWLLGNVAESLTQLCLNPT